MQTKHKIIFADSRALTGIAEDSVDLVVTSPPYPMIQMWDGLFSTMSNDAQDALRAHDGNLRFRSHAS